MKVIKFIKKNYKRFIFQVVSIISVFVIFSISAFAEPFDVSIDMSISKPNITSNTYYVEVLYNNGISAEVDILSVRSNNPNDSIQYPPIDVQITNSSITFVSHFEGTQYLFNCFWITSAGNNGVYQTDGEFLQISFSNIAGIHLYGNFNVISGSLPTNTNWNINYSSDASVIAELEKITNALNSQNNNDIVSSIEQSTDKILHSDTPKPDINTGSVNEHNALDNQIMSNNQQGIDDTKSLFNNFGIDGSTNMAKGMLACGAILERFLNVDFLEDLVDFSLALGIFAFVLGSGFIIASAYTSNKARNDYSRSRAMYQQSFGPGAKRAQAEKRRQEWLAKRGKK